MIDTTILRICTRIDGAGFDCSARLAQALDKRTRGWHLPPGVSSLAVNWLLHAVLAWMLC